MRLDYLAHSCFLLEHRDFRLLFDPYHPDIGYSAPKLYGIDLVVVSHDHHDHNAVDQVTGACQVARGVAKRKIGPLALGGVVGWHGDAEDSEPVSLTLVEWSERRIAHFGDLGCQLDESQLKVFSGLDLLLIPCGGGYTLDGKSASSLVRKLRPKLVVPMHYRTPFLSRDQFPDFQTAEPFVSECQDFCDIEKVRAGWADLDELWAKADSQRPLVLELQHQMT